MPGMRDAAKHANAALPTVSAVLNNGDKYVSDEIRQRVLTAAQDLGYILFEKRRFLQKNIAVILPIITSSFFSNVLSNVLNGIEETISNDKNYLLFLTQTIVLRKNRCI
jgi:DNA-binding LacI/PurR family transcriptional regulator